jgi:hypothetical protein
MIDWLAAQAATIIRVATLVALLCAAIWINVAIVSRLEPRHGERKAWAAGCLLSLAAFFLLIMMFGPALNLLAEFACRDALDFDKCMNPPGAD